MQKTLALAAPAPSLEALRSTSGIRMLRLCDASMLSNRITGVLAVTPSHGAHIPQLCWKELLRSNAAVTAAVCHMVRFERTAMMVDRGLIAESSHLYCISWCLRSYWWT